MDVRPHVEEAELNCKRESYFNKVKKAVAEDRRGEVVFCVIRPNGRIVTVTCSEYPAGIFRIPTGGIGYEEDILQAVFRETKEELGVSTEVLKLCGAIKIRFRYKTEEVMFYSYVFILKETGGNLLADASDDEVSEVREVDCAGLKEIVKSLEDIEESWNDWGRFRAVTTGAVLRFLLESPELLIG